MQYGELPVFIPVLAAGYLLTVYGLLKIAERLRQSKPVASNKIKKVEG